jgi:hypothetical protein
LSNGAKDDVQLPKATAVGPGKGAPSGGKPYKRHWSNYLLDKKLQLRYVLTVALLSALISAALGYLIYRQGHMATTEVLSTFDGFGEDEAWAEVRQQAAQRLGQEESDLVLQMVGVGVGLVLVLSLYLVIMTHKVAGPLFKVSGYFDKMAAGRLGEVYPLRRGDMLIDFYAGFQEMHKSLRGRFKGDVEVMARFLAACDDAGVKRDGALGQEIAELERHVAARKESLS